MAIPVTNRKRDERIEFRATSAEKAMLEQAADAAGTTLTQFALENLTVAAQRVLADRTEFSLDPVARDAWEELNASEARNLPGLEALMERPSPFRAE